MNRSIPWPAIAVAALAAVLLASCGSGIAAGVADKSGSETIVLRLATIDSVNNNGQSFGPQAFFDSLGEVSGGRLQVEVTEVYGDGAADAESRMIEAIASGAIDGGWPSTRAFAAADIDGLGAVEAPLTITSYEAEKALVSGPVADTVLAKLDGSGIVGLGLAVGPLRRPFAADAALVGPDDWQGVRFRAYNSPVQAATVEALGAEPVNLGFGWLDEVNSGNLRGAEFDIAQYAANGLTTEAGYVAANVVLWPKVFVLSISQERFESLSGEQRDWVRQAAELATQASVDATYDEDTLSQELCVAGARFVIASDDQIEALRAAVAPVIEDLASDPDEAPLLAEIQELAAEHPEPDVPDVPASCQQVDAIDTSGTGSIPEEVSSIPDGAYRSEITLAEVEAAGANNAVGHTGTWTLEIDDGTYAIYCRPLDDPQHDCGGSGGYQGALEAGYLQGTGDTVHFVSAPEVLAELTGCQLPVSGDQGHCWPNDSWETTWSLEGDLLTFSDFPSGPVWDEPWQKID